MQNLSLQKVSILDLTSLVTISRATFIETFASVNSEENLAAYLKENINEVKLSEELNNMNSYFYFAFSDEAIVGYLKLNVEDAQTEKHPEEALEIERIYVLEEYHGKQIGKFLLNHAINTAKNLNKKYIWLGVWEKNQKAIQFYERNNFNQFSKHVFMLGDDAQTDYLFRLNLI